MGRAERLFAGFVHAVHGRLPRWLRVVPPTFIGFAVINGFTFGVDMLLLWLSHGIAAIPYPLAVSASFGAASVLAFFLNKVLNFRAHGNTGPQSVKYLVVIVSNYVIWILAFSSLLEWAGVQYQVSRIVAACVEGAYIYLLSRLWVFRPRKKEPAVTVPAAVAIRPVQLQPVRAESWSD